MNVLGYEYAPSARDGGACDWILDGVSVSFHESSGVAANLLPGLRCLAEVEAAAVRFADHQRLNAVESAESASRALPHAGVFFRCFITCGVASSNRLQASATLKWTA